MEVTAEYDSIIVGCANGDVRSQMRFYDQHANRVYGSALRILKNPQEAEDVMQETFITAFQKLKTVNEVAKIPSWLCRIATNKSLNYLKRDRVNWSDLNEETELIKEEEESDLSEISIEEIHECIQSLADGYRIILNLYLIEGYDHKEIAEQMGIGESTSRSQYARARKKLTDIIEEKHGRQS